MNSKDAGIDMDTVLTFANKASDNFRTAYNELRFAGYLTWLGGLLIFLTFVLSLFGSFGLTIQSQVLFVSSGVFLMLLGGTFLTLQNILTFRLEAQSQRHLFETTKLRHALQVRLADSTDESPTSQKRVLADG